MNEYLVNVFIISWLQIIRAKLMHGLEERLVEEQCASLRINCAWSRGLYTLNQRSVDRR